MKIGFLNWRRWLVCWGIVCLPLLSISAEPPKLVYTFDARPLTHLDMHATPNAIKFWDTMHVLAALQGLANRESAQFYIFGNNGFGVDTDQFWLDWFQGEDRWLKDTKIQKITGLKEAVQTFRSVFNGLVVYDPAVPATSDIASTAAGCDGLLPVRFDTTPGSAYDELAVQMKLPVKLWLVNSNGTSLFTGHGQIPDGAGPTSGSAKVDAYRWALKRYVASKLCAPGMAAYYVDAFWLRHPDRATPMMSTLGNHDYFISHRAFFFDLSPWGDEPPNDDSLQPMGLDRREFLEVVRALYNRAQGGMIKVGGFPPWPFKYTHRSAPQNKHEGVSTEWEFGRLISQFNGYMEADAAGLGGMGNASFFQHYPLAKRYPQPNAKPTLADWKARGYVTSEGKVADKFFMACYAGDYDSPAWLYKAVPAFFRDPARGLVPLGWAFDPNLADRAPQALAYAYRHAGTNDFFIAGDSGAGYLNPHALTVRPDSHLPSGLKVWVDHCRPYYERWGMTITGFMLDGSSGASTGVEYGVYRSFSPDGVGTQWDKGIALQGDVPTCVEHDLPEGVEQAGSMIVNMARGPRNQQPKFLWARSVLKSPGWYADLAQRLTNEHAEVVLVDPYTFFGLVRLRVSEGK